MLVKCSVSSPLPDSLQICYSIRSVLLSDFPTRCLSPWLLCVVLCTYYGVCGFNLALSFSENQICEIGLFGFV